MKVHPGHTTVAIDFDATLNDYKGWQGAQNFPPLREGAAEFLERLQAEGVKLVCFTVRNAETVRRWLKQEDLLGYFYEVTDVKPKAAVYLDDRAVCFNGNYDEAFEAIMKFEPYWWTEAHERELQQRLNDAYR